MMIRRKKGLTSLKEDYDHNLHKGSRWILIEADKAASVGDKLKERFEWESLIVFYINYF